eukprot:CAMPEP_0119375394 /NCGR_PEP_ID=MMETSP1334-20130426/35520_1 /TAXON_ID=127549 /ORGANISM="Calcidiscus leptoporus, Strain RCC1130" /LENGTH=102 /DNA_ID=CAMNT_0007393693 /DNA_START=170 /DNA_END=478 /DNA_ORIENTATION=-
MAIPIIPPFNENVFSVWSLHGRRGEGATVALARVVAGRGSMRDLALDEGPCGGWPPVPHGVLTTVLFKVLSTVAMSMLGWLALLRAGVATPSMQCKRWGDAR